jgi:MFS family permease
MLLGVIVGPLLIGALAYAQAQTSLTPAIPTIQVEYGTTAVGATAVASAFFVSGAVTAGLTGRLGDLFGKRRVSLAVLVLFNVGAVLCALAPTLAVLLVGRVVMGTSVALLPLAFAIVRDELPTARVPHALALLGGVVGVGAALGMVTGGLVTDHLGLDWVFWSWLVLGVAALAAVAAFVPESRVRAPGRVDTVGALLLASGLAAPLIAISRTPSWGWWSGRTLALVAVGALILAAFFAHVRRHPEPLLDVPALAGRRLGLANLATLLLGFGLFGLPAIITQFVQAPVESGYGFGATATQAALFMLPGAVFMLCCAPFVGELTSRVGGAIALALGAGVAALALGLLAAVHGHALYLYLWPLLLFAGMTLTMGALPALVLDAAPESRRAESTAVNMVVRNVGSGIGTQVAAAFITGASVGAASAEAGFVHAFVLQAGFCAAACAVALALAGRPPAALDSGAGQRNTETLTLTSMS